MTKYPFSYPTGNKEYPRRELMKDSRGVSYIGFVYDAKGKPLLDNWYKKIQKSSDSSNVRLLLERAVETDNTDILNQRRKVSADLSGMPDNLLDVLNSFQGVKNYFEHLPVEVKKDFNNNVYDFIKRQGKISDNLISYYKSINKTPLNPIKSDDDKIDDNDVNGGN